MAQQQVIQAPKKEMPNYMKFVFGGLAGMGGTCFVQPMDVVKTRMQISGQAGAKREFKNSFDAFRKIFAAQGIPGLYKGIGAGLLRQATYTTGRMGVYSSLNDYYRSEYKTKPSIGASMLMGSIAGACGAFVGTPAEVALIRMQGDAALPLESRRNYKNVANALIRIANEEGVFALWRGVIPTVQRAVIINMTQLASYSQIKNYFQTGPFQMKDGLGLHICASLCSGFLTTAASMPMDMAKTRIQNQPVDKKIYSGTMDVLLKVMRNEGVFALWKGFTPYFCRIGPHTVLVFVFLEQFNKLYSKYVLGGESTGSGL